jgi:acyl CoA:acetate/3-ketoacid CoA transferase
LTEIAAGIDVQRDVLGQMEYPVRIAPKLKIMDITRLDDLLMPAYPAM